MSCFSATWTAGCDSDTDVDVDVNAQIENTGDEKRRKISLRSQREMGDWQCESRRAEGEGRVVDSVIWMPRI